MATEAHHIYSQYDPEDRERLEIETSQCLDESLSLDQAWEREAPRVNRLRAPAPQFVPAVVSYEDWPSGRSKLPESTSKDRSAAAFGSSLSGWYRSLTASRNPTPIPPTPSPPSVFQSTHLASSLTTIPSALARRSSLKQQETTNKNNWFIMKAIQSEPPLSNSTHVPSLSDILDRDPPPLPSQGKYKPPVWLEIGPSNKGFGMLQRAGWNEGEALGPDVSRRKAVETITPVEELFSRSGVNDKGKFRQKADTIRSIRIETKEVEVEGLDDIRELRQVEVVDLTLDSDKEDSDSDNDLEEENVDQKGVSSSLVKDEHMEQPMTHDFTGYERMALLTPIATVLKSDRLGIGLKAKTVGPYKESRKRVTHNAAALAAHVRAAEESRKRRERFGRGKKGFERQHKKEEERRQAMLTYLKNS